MTRKLLALLMSFKLYNINLQSFCKYSFKVSKKFVFFLEMFLQVSIAVIKSNHMKQSELYREVIALSQSCVLPLLLRKSLLSKSSSFLLRNEFYQV